MMTSDTHNPYLVRTCCVPGLGLSTWHPHSNLRQGFLVVFLGFFFFFFFAFITAFYPYITEEVHGAQRGYEMCKGHPADTLTDVLISNHCFRGVTE